MVDDDKMLIDLYKERLELAGYQVEVSRDGEEGLAKIHTAKPDLVLLDIMMPKVNGYEALASIKSDPATKDIPVIILSALMRDVNKSKAVESGADDYIIKSEAMPADVIKKIEAVLNKYHKNVPGSSGPASPAPPSAPTAPPEPPEPPISPPPPALQETPPSEIQFEPSGQPQTPTSNNNNPAPATPSIGGDDLTSQGPIANPVSPTVQAPAQEPVIIPQKPANEKPAKGEQKASPIVIFFLILICFLILASDIFFYMKYITGK